METLINLHIEKLPEGFYLATSEDVQGLVVQGRTLGETVEIARDVARRLMEEQGIYTAKNTGNTSMDFPVVV